MIYLNPFLLVLCSKLNSITSKFHQVQKLAFVGHSLLLIFRISGQQKKCLGLYGLFFLFTIENLQVSCFYVLYCCIMSLSVSTLYFIFQNTGVPDETLVSSSGLLFHHKYACKKLSHRLGSKPAQVTCI